MKQLDGERGWANRPNRRSKNRWGPPLHQDRHNARMYGWLPRNGIIAVTSGGFRPRWNISDPLILNCAEFRSCTFVSVVGRKIGFPSWGKLGNRGEAVVSGSSLADRVNFDCHAFKLHLWMTNDASVFFLFFDRHITRYFRFDFFFLLLFQSLVFLSLNVSRFSWFFLGIGGFRSRSRYRFIDFWGNGTCVFSSFIPIEIDIPKRNLDLCWRLRSFSLRFFSFFLSR